ncbi:MAG TPA: sugar phosphate isomerase/epimerase family protein [Phycisphaerae bacterium]|nr:sugar phosphate isomerase/epimerase family protein [Phycisphaerae bacterium]
MADSEMMTLGTVGAFGFEAFPQPEVLRLYARAGCEVVQAYRHRDKAIAAKEVVAVCGGLGLRIDSLHAHFGDDLDPSSEDEAARAAAVAYYEREAEYCRQLGGDLVVIHPSPPNAPPGDVEHRYAQLRKSFDEYARLGERTGVRFAFENMPGYHPVGADVRRLVDEIASVGSERVVFLLDVAHAHLTCGIGAAIDMAGRRIAYTHVCDNDGASDMHLLPYRGNLPWDECHEGLRRVGYNGVFLLEVFEKAEDLPGLLTEEWKRKMRVILNNRQP